VVCFDDAFLVRELVDEVGSRLFELCDSRLVLDELK